MTGIGKNNSSLGKAAPSLLMSHTDKGIGAQAQGVATSASFARRVWACFRHDALAPRWVPQAPPKRPTLKLRHGALRLELPKGVDQANRARYEEGLFRLFFSRIPFKASDRPLGFATAIASDGKLNRRMVKDAILFAHRVMRYAEECGIGHSTFLEAAGRFGEATVKDDSIAHFMKLCFEHRKPGAFGTAMASVHIRGVRQKLDHGMVALDRRNSGYLPLFDKYCAGKSLSDVAETVAGSRTSAWSRKQSPEDVFKQLYFLRCKIAFDCLQRYHAVLTGSGDPAAMLVAAEESEALLHYRRVLLNDRKQVPIAIDTLLKNLRAAAVAAVENDAVENDAVEAGRPCVEALTRLLTIDPEAHVTDASAKILVELGLLYEESHALKGLVPEIVARLEAIPNPSPDVQKFLQKYQV